MSKELTRKAFHGLNPSLQDTFILQKAEGWTNRELAQALGITVSTVKSRVFRARVRLAAAVAQSHATGFRCGDAELVSPSETRRWKSGSGNRAALFLL